MLSTTLPASASSRTHATTSAIRASRSVACKGSSHDRTVYSRSPWPLLGLHGSEISPHDPRVRMLRPQLAFKDRQSLLVVADGLPVLAE